jgi:peptide/nickel transport system ATP-binding protein
MRETTGSSDAFEPLLRVSDLTVHFPTYQGVVRAVENVDLEVSPGEVIGLVGETSCGKSVTGLALLGLVPPPGKVVSGEVLFRGRDLRRLGRAEMREMRGRGITLISQNPMTSLSPVFTIGTQMVDVVRANQSVGRAPARHQSLETLQDVAMPDPEQVIKGYAHELSGGMQQRVTIAEALGCRTQLLIADEPTTALDVSVQLQILKLLKELVAQRGLSIIMISHDIGIIANMCDRVYVMYAARIVEHGPVHEIVNAAVHPYTRALIGSVPRFRDGDRELVYLKGDVPDPIWPPPGCRLHPRCPLATGECSEQTPAMVEVGVRHGVACLKTDEILRGRGTRNGFRQEQPPP